MVLAIIPIRDPKSSVETPLYLPVSRRGPHSSLKNRNGDLASDLYTLFRRVRNGNFNYQQYRALSRLVIKKASDFDTWNAVFNLIRSVS